MTPEQGYQTYPLHNIDPAKKDLAWGMQYVKSAWYDWSYVYPRTIFYNAADKYEEYRLYALGKQPINIYKKLMGVDQQTNETSLNLSWEVRPFVCQKRDIAIAKMCEQEHNIVCTPIDPTAKANLDRYYAEAKAKMAMRAVLQQTNPELAQHPMIQPQNGEPLDMEEMQMRIDFGEQFNRSKDAEEGIQLVFYENNIAEFRKRQYETQFDCGVSGYYEWMGEDNRPKFREVKVEAVVTNFCRYGDFRDLIHAGEVVDVSIIDLAVLNDEAGHPVFTNEQIQHLTDDIAGRWSNPALVGRSTGYIQMYDRKKVKVLEMEFYSYNDYNWESNTDKRGNPKFSRAPYEKKSNKNLRKRIKVVYQVKWIIGTDYAYDFKLKDDQKRSVNPKKKAETTLGYKFHAPNFYEMKATGMMERLKPLIDDYQLTIFNIENIKSRIIPNGWWIDLDALENVALNKAGANMTPMQLLQMFHETGVLVGRSQGVMGDNVNYKPIIPIQNSIATELQALYQDLAISMNQMQSMIGLNDVTDASTPNPKLLNGVATMADEGTNNSLWPMIDSQKNLLEKLANDVIIRLQQAIRKGGISGYAPALNTTTLKFIDVPETLALREYGIMLEEKSTDDQKQFLMQQMSFDIQNGMLDTSDAIYIMNVYNVKQAQQLLAYRVKKAKQQKQQEVMANQQQTIQGQQQSAQQAQQMAQQLEMLQHQNKMQQIQAQGEIDMQIAKIKMGVTQQVAEQTNQVKMAGHLIEAQTKQDMQQRELAQPQPESKS